MTAAPQRAKDRWADIAYEGSPLPRHGGRGDHRAVFQYQTGGGECAGVPRGAVVVDVSMKPPKVVYRDGKVVEIRT